MIFVQLLRPTLLPKKTGFLFSVILSMIIWRKKSYWTKMGPKIHCVHNRHLSHSSEAEDVTQSSQQFLLNSSNNVNKTVTATATPSVDFPLQFNFGSTYASSLTIFFDNNDS
jgi:hypothetical protein